MDNMNGEAFLICWKVPW